MHWLIIFSWIEIVCYIKYWPVDLQLEKSLLDQKQQQALAEKQKKEIERMDEIRKREQERILEVSMISPKGATKSPPSCWNMYIMPFWKKHKVFIKCISEV